jgi:hypothetical protein
MDYRAVTALALRLTGVAVLVQITPSASAAFIGLIQIGATSPRQALMLAAFSTLIPLVVGLALIWFPARLGSLVTGSTALVEADLDSDRLGHVALVAVGVYFFATGIFDFVYYGSKLWMFEAWVRKREYSDDVSPPSYDVAGIITGAARLVIGAVLAFKARTFASWILRIRETRPKS